MTDDAVTPTPDTPDHRIYVYHYGLLPPRDWGDPCEAELRGMTALWNKCVEIEQRHREAVRALTADNAVIIALDQQAAALVERHSTLKAERAAMRKASRSRLKTPELDASIKQCTIDIKAVRVEAKERRRALRGSDEAKERLTKMDEERKAQVKIAYQQCGLYWGNYNAVLDSYRRGRSAAMKFGTMLKFRRHRDRPEDGRSKARLKNQLQGGRTITELEAGACSQVTLARGDRNNRALLTMRINRAGATVTWPVVYDRPIPPEARIQEVTVTRVSVADAWYWSVSFLVRLPLEDKAEVADTTVCGIDLGWRRLNDGIRVATIYDGTRSEFVVLPEIFLRRLDRVEELQSLRTKSIVAPLAAVRELQWPHAPAPLRPLAMRALRTKAPRDLHDLAVAWREHPGWHGDAAAEVARWRAQDRKDWQEQDGLSRRITNARRDLYRCAVKRIAERFGRAAIEDIDWRRIGEIETADGQTNEIALATGRYRSLAAPGTFIAELRRTGIPLYEHNGKSTWECWYCGREHTPADRSQLHHQCRNCNRTWDQDVNAAHNLRAAALASTHVPPSGPAALAWEKRNDNRTKPEAA